MADIKSLIDFIVNSVLNAFNALKAGMGIFFVVWLVKVFFLPRLSRLISAFKG